MAGPLDLFSVLAPPAPSARPAPGPAPAPGPGPDTQDRSHSESWDKSRGHKAWGKGHKADKKH